MTCPACGQRFDMRRLRDVLHHAEKGHEPLGRESAAPTLRFVPPMMPTLVEQPPTGPRWFHEIKFDGYRTQVQISRSTVRAFTRKGHDWTARYLPIIEAAATLPCEDAIIDGELIVQDEQGRCDFASLKGAIEREPERLILMAFDLLHLDGRDLRKVPLENRRGLLERLPGPNDPSRRIQFSQHNEDGEALLDAVEAMGLEGIVSKKRGSSYGRGPSRSWLKTKCFCEQELVVIGAEKGDRGPVALLARETERGLEYAGGAMVTLPQPERAQFWEQIERLKVPKPTLPMTRRSQASWTRPELRVRVRALKGEDMLRHATVRSLAQ